MGQDEGWSHGKADFGEGVENLLVLYRLDEGQGGFPSWVGGLIMGRREVESGESR